MQISAMREPAGAARVKSGKILDVVHIERDDVDQVTLYTEGEEYFILDQALINALKRI